MTAGKLQQHLAAALAKASQFICTLKGSLLTLVILNLISFTYLSIDSLHPSSSSSSTPLDSIYLLSAKDTVVDGDELASSDLYHSRRIFRLNYEEMERNFKVFIYPDVMLAKPEDRDPTSSCIYLCI